jgi:hypothetical protein
MLVFVRALLPAQKSAASEIGIDHLLVKRLFRNGSASADTALTSANAVLPRRYGSQRSWQQLQRPRETGPDARAPDPPQSLWPRLALLPGKHTFSASAHERIIVSSILNLLRAFRE